MYYFIIPVVLSIYFELFGRWVASKFKNVIFRLYYPLGFFSVLAIIYPTLLLSINNCSFFVLLAIYGLLFVASIVLIVKDFNKLDHSIGIVDVLIVVVITVVLTIYSSKTPLGNLHGFDTLLYLNFTTDNIGLSALNSKGIYLNGLPEISMTYYSGQVYYYFAGVIIYIFGKIATLLKIEYFYMPSFVWTFQLIFDFILGAIIVEVFNSKAPLSSGQ